MQQQGQKQIPCGNDNKKDNGNSKCNGKGKCNGKRKSRFPAGMTTRKTTARANATARARAEADSLRNDKPGWRGIGGLRALRKTTTGRENPQRRKAYHHGDLRAALMTAALSLIDQHGVKGFSLKDAAVMAGVSTAAPYRHFADKNALLGAIQVEGFGLFNETLSDAFASATVAGERIEELGVAYVLFALRHPAHFRVMFGVRDMSAPPQEQDEQASGFHLLLRGVAELHPEASEEVRHDMVLACWSVVHGFAMLQIETAFVGMTDVGAIERQLRRTLRLMIGMDVAQSK